MTETQAEVDRMKASDRLGRATAHGAVPSPAPAPTRPLTELEVLEAEDAELSIIIKAQSPEQRQAEIRPRIAYLRECQAVQDEARVALFRVWETAHQRAMRWQTEDTVCRFTSFTCDALKGFDERDSRRQRMDSIAMGMGSVIRGLRGTRHGANTPIPAEARPWRALITIARGEFDDIEAARAVIETPLAVLPDVR